MERRSVDERVQEMANGAGRSRGDGSDIVNLRFYVYEDGRSPGGKVALLTEDGELAYNADGDGIALVLDAHEHAGPIVQAVLDHMREARGRRVAGGAPDGP